MVTPIEMKQEQVPSNPEGGNCEDGMKTVRSFQLGHPPNWTCSARRMAELVVLSISLGHLPNWTGPAWRMDGRAGRLFDPARPSAELDGLLCPPFNKTGITYVTGC
ncbi:hypothetical protein F2Q70_00004950 [Brassica cretica]|uniref:Uncharacterized protein n=1 Tax=Brassica cretica TaxID=69181 RepID=A0A8S9IYC5_BRACR|nr:hypothetical protein F2Q70_00004950 [Brassica cretica]